MKVRPILFSTPMVQAILDGRKKQTRRIIKPQPQDVTIYGDGKVVWHPEVIKRPYEIGDVLWVRETFGQIISLDEIVYKADICSPEVDKPFFGWKPSIFMPKTACRLYLQVKNIRVERLNDISEEDAIAEGIENLSETEFNCNLFKNYLSSENEMDYQNFTTDNAVLSFQTLWHKINGPTSWVKNPFVWVIEFERIDKPANFI